MERKVVSGIMLTLLLVMLLICSLPPIVGAETTGAGASNPTTVTLEAIDDSYVNSSSPDSNYGSLTSIKTEITTGTTRNYTYTYIMFDLSSIPSDAVISSANLSLYMTWYIGALPHVGGTIEVYYCSDTSWTELGITWNSKPPFDPERTSYVRFGTEPPEKYYDWDVTSDVSRALSNGKLTEVVKWYDYSDPDVYGRARFQSKEAANKPKLIVDVEEEEPWNIKAPYPEYAPSGVPDFDQRQWGTYNWTDSGGAWSHCGPVAVTNSLWWFDSKYESVNNPNPLPPPTISDNFPLVQAYGAWDDHDPQNVPPLVEHLAWLMDCDAQRTGPASGGFWSGTYVRDMEAGLAQYLSWSGVNPLGDVNGDGVVNQTDVDIVTVAMGSTPGTGNWNLAADIYPETVTGPHTADNVVDQSDLDLINAHLGETGIFCEHTAHGKNENMEFFYYIEEEVERSQDVVLLLGFYQGDSREGGHYVTVAGVNSNTVELLISDPIRDNFEAGKTPGRSPVPHVHLPPEPPHTTHNNASLVSQDAYKIVKIPHLSGYDLVLDGYFSPESGLEARIEYVVITSPKPKPAYLVVQGLDNRIYYRIYDSSSDSWDSWDVVPTGLTCDGPAAAVLGGRLHLVVRGMTGDLYHGWVDLWTGGFSGWSRISGDTPSPPALAAFSTDLYLVVRGMDNRVYFRRWDAATGWGGWVLLPGATPDGPAAAVFGGDLHVVVRGMTGGLWHGWVDLSTGAFSGWTLLAGDTPSRPELTASATSLYLVVRGMDDRVYHNEWSGVWGGWNDLPTGTTSDGPAAAVLGGELHFVVRGMTGGLWHAYLDLSTSAWSGWTWLSGSTPSAPELAEPES